MARSDSSMDDCNCLLRVRLYRLDVGSDSSMDDCNSRSSFRRSCQCIVQIPLWTIVTQPLSHGDRHLRCSDSSMDDCNDFDGDALAVPGAMFRFLYGRL